MKKTTYLYLSMMFLITSCVGVTQQPTDVTNKTSSSNISSNETKTSTSVSISPDAPELKPQEIKNKLVGNYQMPNVVYSVSTNSDASIIAAGDRQGNVKVWKNKEEYLTLKLSPENDSSNHFVPVAVSNNGKYLAVQNPDLFSIDIYSLETKEVLFKLSQYSSELQALKFNKDDSLLISASRKSVKIWDMKSKQEAKTISISGLDVNRLDITDSNKFIETYTGAYTSIYDSDKGIRLGFKGVYDLFSTSYLEEGSLLVYSPNESLLGTNISGKIRIINPLTLSLISEMPMPKDTNIPYSDGRILKFSPDNKILVQDYQPSNGNANRIDLYDVNQKSFLLSISQDNQIMSLEFSQNSKNIVTGSASGEIRVVNIK